MCIHTYICLRWASTLHKHVSCTTTLSRHWRMNLQHAVQHLLNVSLARLHTNKPAGACRLTPTPAFFDIVPARMIRTKSQGTCSFAFVDVGNALTISAPTRSACAQTRFCCLHQFGVLVLKRASTVCGVLVLKCVSAVRTIEILIFTCMRIN